MRKRPFLLLATEFLLGIVCVREQLPAWGVLAVLLLVYTTPWKERGMRKVLFAAGLPGMFLLGMLQMQRQIDFRQQYLQKLTDGQEVRLAGKIDRIEPKTRCVYYYLKDCTVEAESQTLPCNDVIAYVSSASHYLQKHPMKGCLMPGSFTRVRKLISAYGSQRSAGSMENRIVTGAHYRI